MYSKQDGKGIPPYAAETAREVGNLGGGGHGNMASKADADRRGVTAALAGDVEKRASKRLAEKAMAERPEDSGENVKFRRNRKAPGGFES